MTYKYRKMTIMRVFDFDTEDACEAYLIRVRWPDGLMCTHCQGKEFEKREGKTRAYRCVVCHRFLSPTAGTIFHRTRTSLQQWFIALFLVATDKRGLSALFLAEQIGVSYPTAWAMIQRMRHAMAKRDLQYTLSGHIEMDEMFIGAPTEAKKRGRGTEKTPVLVAVSFSPAKDGKEYVGFAKLRAVEIVDAPTIVQFAKDVIEKGSTIRSDGYTVYPPLEDNGFIHDRHPVGKRKAHVILPHVHTFISNLRSFVMGTYHGLDETHLQQYLDEFCWRFNRRKRVQSRHSAHLRGFSSRNPTMITFSRHRDGCARGEVRRVDGLPNTAEASKTKIQDRLPALDSPRHARLFETLGEHGLASGFRHPAANR